MSSLRKRGGILSNTHLKGEGKTTIQQHADRLFAAWSSLHRLFSFKLIAERQILIHATALIVGVVVGIELSGDGKFVSSAGGLVLLWVAASLFGLAGLVWRFGSGSVALVAVFWLLVGIFVVQAQFSRLPPVMSGDRLDLRITGQVEQLDGRQESRLRLWLRANEFTDVPGRTDTTLLRQLEGRLVRLSFDAEKFNVHLGDRVAVFARLYPPPSRVLAGLPDYQLRARARRVVASGYVHSLKLLNANDASMSWRVRLDRERQRRADRINAEMTQPEGGIAAALLIGDRRYVSQHTYDLFRQSGLAHLLAISGLQMGLLCFGVVAALRRVMALFPHFASRFPVHKIAALGGFVAGLLYVLLSGMSISAVRAFLMAALVNLSWMIDRPGVTLRHVAIAAILILLINPLAVLSAGFQLSFAATAGLVLWFDRARMYEARVLRSRYVRWMGHLILASLIASLATLPLTAQHFGAVTPWGVFANLIGIPLTGVWIMPAGLVVLTTEFLPVPEVVHDASLTVMQADIHVLVHAANWFASLPASPVYLPPPGWIALLPVAFACLMLATLDARRDMRLAVMVIAGLASVSLLLGRPSVKGVLFVKDRHTALVLPRQGGSISVHFPAEIRRQAISPFLADHAALVLGVAEGDGKRDRAWLRIAGDMAVVTHRAKLTDECRSNVRIVLSLVPADYPCSAQAKLYNLHEIYNGNYLIIFNKNELKLKSVDNQYLRMRPVSRP